MQRLIALVAVVVLSIAAVAEAKTFMLEDGPNGRIAMRHQMEFRVDRLEVEPVIYRFALPAIFQNNSVNLPLDSQHDGITPQPTISTIEQDRYCDSFQKIVRNNFTNDSRVNLISLEKISRKPENC